MGGYGGGSCDEKGFNEGVEVMGREEGEDQEDGLASMRGDTGIAEGIIGIIEEGPTGYLLCKF